MSNLYLEIAALGAVTGLRSMAGPAVVADRLAGEYPALPQPARALASPAAANLLKLAALGEILADKLPFVPARTDAPALGGRLLMGAVAGSAWAAARRGDALAGALVGAAAAAAGTFAGYHARRAITQKTGVPDTLVAVLEDGLAYGTARDVVGG